MPKKVILQTQVPNTSTIQESKNFLIIKPQICCPEYHSFQRLESKTAVITSAHDRVSKAVAIAYAKEGADLVLIYHHSKYEHEMEELKAYLGTIGSKVHCIKSSTFDEYKCRKLFDQIMRKVDKIDVLVNNFPISNKIDPSEGHYLLKKNDTLKIQSLFIIGKLAHEYVSPHGVVINSASVCAYSQPDQLMFYSAMKAAIQEYTKEMHAMMEYYEKNIRVNGITTGFIWNDVPPENLGNYEELPLHLKSIKPKHPYEIVPLFVFLASKESTIISGESLNASSKIK